MFIELMWCMLESLDVYMLQIQCVMLCIAIWHCHHTVTLKLLNPLGLVNHVYVQTAIV